MAAMIITNMSINENVKMIKKGSKVCMDRDESSRSGRTASIANMIRIFLVVNLISPPTLGPLFVRATMDIHRGQVLVQTDDNLQYVESSTINSHIHITKRSIHEHPSLMLNSVKFYPPSLDFGKHGVGMPHSERIQIQNLDCRSNLNLISISGSSQNFHCSFFKDKVVPPLSNTTFEILFLAQHVGFVENILFIHTSRGSFKYKVYGEGTYNPYRIRSFVGARVPVNSSYTPLIYMHNPHSSTIQVEEIYSSGGDLHLELPTGEAEAHKDLWEIKPYETKSIMRASFIGRQESNHTAYIRIKTNRDTPPSPTPTPPNPSHTSSVRQGGNSEMIVIPVEVEVSSEPGIYSPQELLDFGMLRTVDEASTVRLSLINSGLRPVHIVNVTVQPPNPAIQIEFRPVQVKPDILHPMTVAVLSFTPSQALSSKQWNGKIVVKSKNSQYKLSIPYQARVLNGALQYNTTSTLFYTGSNEMVIGDDTETATPHNITTDLTLISSFSQTIAVYNVSLPTDVQHLFTVYNFSEPVMLLGDGARISLLNLTYHPTRARQHLSTLLTIHTNISTFTLPLHVYNGRLQVVPHTPDLFKGILDFGTLAVGEKRTMNFTLKNSNPVNIEISRYGANLAGTLVRLLSVDASNGSYSEAYNHTSASFNDEPHSFTLRAFHEAVFSVELTAPGVEGTYAAEIIFNTQFEYLYVPITLRTAVGSLIMIPDKLLFSLSFPSKVSEISLMVHSTFDQTLEVQTIKFTPTDSRFVYLPSTNLKHSPVYIHPQRDSSIGSVIFDPRNDCAGDCYASLPTHTPPGHTWLMGSTLDSEVTDTDQYLFSRLRQKFDLIGYQSSVNVTVHLDTNQLRGFLFTAQAQLIWPSLTHQGWANTLLHYPLTQIGNSSILDVLLENPSDSPVIIQVVPMSLYPNVQTIIDTLISHAGDPDLAVNLLSDQNTGSPTQSTGPDDLYMDLDEEPLAQQSNVGDVFSLVDTPQSRWVLVGGEGRGGRDVTLGVRPHRGSLARVLPPHSSTKFSVRFTPLDTSLTTSAFIIRNNLTILDAVVVRGRGGTGELSINRIRSGSSSKQLLFDMNDKHLKNCDKKQAGVNIKTMTPNFSVKRTFTARNIGDLPVTVHGFSIGSEMCEGYGFRVINCTPFILDPEQSHKIDIMFTPDFTMSRIRQTLTLHTSLPPNPGALLTFTLQATLPVHMLSQCSAALPRPAWEHLLYYAVLVAMMFLLVCVIVASYFEADRVITSDLIRQRTEKVFDLKAIVASVRVSESNRTKRPLVRSLSPVATVANSYRREDGGKVSRLLGRLWGGERSGGPAVSQPVPVVRPRMSVSRQVSEITTNSRSTGVWRFFSLMNLISVTGRLAHNLARYLWRTLVRWYTPSTSRGTPRRATEVSGSDTRGSSKSVLPPSIPIVSKSGDLTVQHRNKNLEQENSTKRNSFGNGSSLSGGYSKCKQQQGEPGRGEASARGDTGRGEPVSREEEILCEGENSGREKDLGSEKVVQAETQQQQRVVLSVNKNKNKRGGGAGGRGGRNKGEESPVTETSSPDSDEKCSKPLKPQPPVRRSKRAHVTSSSTSAGTGKRNVSSAGTGGEERVVVKSNLESILAVDDLLNSVSLELPYTIRSHKEEDERVLRGEGGSKTSSCSSSTSGDVPPCHPPPNNLRKRHKTRNTNIGARQGSRLRPDDIERVWSDRDSSPIPQWEMPTTGYNSGRMDDLTELSAQTDAFARSNPNPTTSSCSAASSTSPSSCKPAAESRSTSYSSVVSSCEARPSSDEGAGLKTAVTAAAARSGLIDLGQVVRPAESSTPPAPVGSTRPIAAVGATRRSLDSWTDTVNDPSSCLTAADQLNMLQLLQLQQQLQASRAYESQLAGGGGAYVDPVMAGFINPSAAFLPNNDGLDPYGYTAAAAASLAQQQQQQQLLLKLLQAENARKLLEQQLRQATANNTAAALARQYDWLGRFDASNPGLLTDQPMWGGSDSNALLANYWNNPSLLTNPAQSNKLIDSSTNQWGTSAVGFGSGSANSALGEAGGWSDGYKLWEGLKDEGGKTGGETGGLYNPFSGSATSGGSIWNPSSPLNTEGGGWGEPGSQGEKQGDEQTDKEREKEREKESKKE